MTRRGHPAPLGLNLALAILACQEAVVLSGAVADRRFPWDRDLAERGRALTVPGPAEVLREAAQRLARMARGIKVWRDAPVSRPMPEFPVLWSAGASRLLDCGASGLPVLVLPSLINRAAILDLGPDRSLLRFLAGSGLHPLLLDWGEPGREEQAFTLERYVRQRVLPALDLARSRFGGRSALLGYCMGGTLAAGIAARRGASVDALVTMGAPWAFPADASLAGQLRALSRRDGGAALGATLSALRSAFGVVPSELFDLLFALLNPVQTLTKFRKFADSAADATRLGQMARLEDWLADGVDMAEPAARDLLIGWHTDDRPARGTWNLLDGAVRLADIACPSMVVTGTTDHIAPDESAAPLARGLPGARHLRAETGHVGMIAGSSAPVRIWTPVAEFLKAV